MLLFQLFERAPGLIIPWLTALVAALTIHEFAHALAAYRLGDSTAERAGRLSLNPLVHLDPMGSLMLLLVGFGWARPVPVNPSLIGKGRFGQFMVSFAGIFANISFALFCLAWLTLIFNFESFSADNYLIKFLAFLVYINISLFIFNLIPLAPLDGFGILKSFAPELFFRVAPFLERWGFFILLGLVFFTNAIGFLIVVAVQVISGPFGLNIFNLAFGGL